MENPTSKMVTGCPGFHSLFEMWIRDGTVLVCSAGSDFLISGDSGRKTTRASISAFGMKTRDGLWRWRIGPRSCDSNLTALESAKTLAQLLGREVASLRQVRDLMPQPVEA